MRFYSLLRESSDPQERKKGLAHQWRQLRRFCETWPGGPHTIVHHLQITESASRGSRFEWQEAVEREIELYHQGAVDAILFPEVDRESRNPLISVPILNKALGAGIPLFFTEEQLQLNPGDPDAVELYTQAVAKSCSYLATMVRKCRGGRFDWADIDRKLPSNTKMFTFDIVEGKLVPNQAQAEALREAAQIALKKGRLAPAAKWLNAQGFQITVNKPFTTVTLHGLFRNRALIGETIINFREKTVILEHEPILDTATFDALQLMLDARRREQRSKVFYVLSGLVHCGCGAKFEATKTGGKRYYYRCSQHCGEPVWRKDGLEWEVHEAFSRYLEHRESRRQSLELAQQLREKLERDKQEVERGIAVNNREWRVLLDMELANYPDMIVSDKKRELTSERESLFRRKSRIDIELEALPHIDPEEVEVTLSELEKPFRMCNTGGLLIPHPIAWERTPTESLSQEQAYLLRETLLKLNSRIKVRNRSLFISGSLPLTRVRAKQGAS